MCELRFKSFAEYVALAAQMQIDGDNEVDDEDLTLRKQCVKVACFKVLSLINEELLETATNTFGWSSWRDNSEKDADLHFIQLYKSVLNILNLPTPEYNHKHCDRLTYFEVCKAMHSSIEKYLTEALDAHSLLGK